MPQLPLPGTTIAERAWYTRFRVADRSRITPWNFFDMWFSARSVYTTEYSSRPSGSTSGSRAGMGSPERGSHCAKMGEHLSTARAAARPGTPEAECDRKARGQHADPAAKVEGAVSTPASGSSSGWRGSAWAPSAAPQGLASQVGDRPQLRRASAPSSALV